MNHDDRYALHSRLQDAMANTGASYESLKCMPYVGFTTFYHFIKAPEKTKDRSLPGIALACEFLEAALKARLLPVSRDKIKEKVEIFDKLYETWWNNDKKFPDNVTN